MDHHMTMPPISKQVQQLRLQILVQNISFSVSTPHQTFPGDVIMTSHPTPLRAKLRPWFELLVGDLFACFSTVFYAKTMWFQPPFYIFSSITYFIERDTLNLITPVALFGVQHKFFKLKTRLVIIYLFII